MGSHDNSAMARFVFSHSLVTLDPKVAASARRTATAMGAKVVRSIAGTMLVEGTPTLLSKLAGALPEWKTSVDQPAAARLPEKSPGHRAAVAGRTRTARPAKRAA